MPKALMLHERQCSTCAVPAMLTSTRAKSRPLEPETLCKHQSNIKTWMWKESKDSNHLEASKN